MRLLLKIFLIISLVNCGEEREFLNPFDSKVDPANWMPSNFNIVVTGQNTAKVSWTQDIKNIEGFILTKITSTKTEKFTLSKDKLTFEDLALVAPGQPCSNVNYEIQAKAGENLSKSVEKSLSQKFPGLSTASAGIDIDSQQLNITLAANTPASNLGETGLWTIISGAGGTIASPAVYNSAFSGSAYTPYVLRWTIKGACGTSADDVVINLKPLPTVTTKEISLITGTTATIQVVINSDNGSPIIQRGIVYGTSTGPTINNSKINAIGTNSTFTLNLTGLSNNTKYFVRGFAENSGGVGYGNELTFTTSTPATVTTNAVTNISSKTATSGGNVTNSGGSTVTERGVCWSTSSSPTISGNRTIDGSGTGTFTSQLTGLSPSTKYFVRAYATNATGTSYGSEVIFTTIDLSTLTTKNSTNVTGSTAYSGGNITSDGGSTVTARGVCWSTSPNPTTSNSKTSNGIGSGDFTSYIEGLTKNTTYYLRAYATNSAGTSYGNQVTFQTQNSFTGTVTLGTGNSTSGTTSAGSEITPYSSFWQDSRHQYLIRASELTAAGAGAGIITSLLFNHASSNSATLKGLTFKIGLTPLTDLTSTVTNLTSLYTGNDSLADLVGWNGVVGLNFQWDGVSNIVIEVCFDNTTNAGNTSVYYSTTNFISVRHNFINGSTGCSLSLNNTGNNRPNIRIQF